MAVTKLNKVNEIVDQDTISTIGINQKEVMTAEMLGQIIDTIFSEDDSKLVQVTDLKRSELPSAYALEFMWHFLVKRWCFNPVVRKNIRQAINKVYQLRNSIDRTREKRLFEIFKTETYVPFYNREQQHKKWI